MLLVECFARAVARAGWEDDSVLVLAPNRLVASELRRQVERRLDRAMAGTPARTAPSLAFALLQRHAAERGEAPLRLLTGTAHDEAVESVIDEVLEGGGDQVGGLRFAPEALRSDAFRAELRELGRVLDDFGMRAAELRVGLRTAGGASPAPSPELVEQWSEALSLLELVEARIERDRPGELTASAMLRAACSIVRDGEAGALPRLVLIDDAGELGEGALALLAALSGQGTKVWAFGDPDIATGAFHGERTRVLAGLSAELIRRGATESAAMGEQIVVLETVYRHGDGIRGLVRSLAERIGAAGAGQQRAAGASGAEGEPAGGAPSEIDPVRFAVVSTPAEQVGVVAHRMRAARLGLTGAPRVPWSQMAVICRSRGEVKRVCRLLAAHQVPSSIAAGGVVLREHQLVRELVRLLQHALDIAPVNAREVLELLGGTVGGLDPIALRRLRGALRLQEVRSAAAEDRAPASADDLLLEAFLLPGREAVLDMRAARRLQRLGRLAADASAVHRAGGTPREVLWQLWQGTGLSDELQRQALDGRGARSDDAHRSLDAVVGLFFALQRHEEQDSVRPIAAVLEDLLLSAVPEDSLAPRSEREVVTVTTPQGVIGREFDLVCVLGLQEGSWPNLRSRGSLLGVTALERWLRGDAAERPSRRDTMHDELRLMTHSVARARTEVLVVAIANEDQHPSPFFALGRRHRIEEALPSTRLTLRGAVAEMRRRLVNDPADREALESLAELARAGIPGAHPDEWYGALPPSTEAPLADIDGDPEAAVTVSPSQMERAEACPLDWIVSKLAAGETDYRANIGTLLHRALETAHDGITAEEILETVTRHWGSLRFEAEWQSRRALAEAERMSEALASYLAGFERSDELLLAKEASFTLPIDYARLTGAADRIEARMLDDGSLEVTVVDLKTGRRTPSAKDLEQHAQLQAYQLGALEGAFVDVHGQPIEAAAVAGAKLVYVHPEALGKTLQRRGERYTVIEQAGLEEQGRSAFEQRVLDVARLMAGAGFTAQLEHHCENPHAPSRACALHIIPAVSHA